jgi:hypothetical protein
MRIRRPLMMEAGLDPVPFGPAVGNVPQAIQQAGRRHAGAKGIHWPMFHEDPLAGLFLISRYDDFAYETSWPISSDRGRPRGRASRRIPVVRSILARKRSLPMGWFWLRARRIASITSQSSCGRNRAR